VIDGVERLGRIEQEDIFLDVISDALVEELVEVSDMGVTVDAGEEALLSGVEEAGKSGHDSAGDGTGQETVVSIGDTDRPGVGDQPVSFLGSRNRKPWLKPAGGVSPLMRALRTPWRTEAEASGTARQAAKGMPSGPGVEFLEVRIESRTASRSGAVILSVSTLLV